MGLRIASTEATPVPGEVSVTRNVQTTGAPLSSGGVTVVPVNDPYVQTAEKSGGLNIGSPYSPPSSGVGVARGAAAPTPPANTEVVPVINPTPSLQVVTTQAPAWRSVAFIAMTGFLFYATLRKG